VYVTDRLKVKAMTWNEVHRRYLLSRRIVDSVERSDDGATALLWREDIEDVFGGFDEFLRHVEHTWYTRLEAQLDADDDVWGLLARQEPGIRLILETFADHPALADVPSRHWRLLTYLGAA
jgi:hypothetical protein